MLCVKRSSGTMTTAESGRGNEGTNVSPLRGIAVASKKPMNETIFLDCVCSVTCDEDFEGSIQRAIQIGWRAVQVSDGKHWRKTCTRTHLGFCPKCAIKFSVTDRVIERPPLHPQSGS